jgi:hypothetical protein
MHENKECEPTMDTASNSKEENHMEKKGQTMSRKYQGQAESWMDLLSCLDKISHTSIIEILKVHPSND